MEALFEFIGFALDVFPLLIIVLVAIAAIYHWGGDETAGEVAGVAHRVGPTQGTTG